MYMSLQGRYVGKDTKKSKSGSTYNVVSLVQGTEMFTAICDDDIYKKLFENNIEFGTTVEAILDYNPKFNSFRIASGDLI